MRPPGDPDGPTLRIDGAAAGGRGVGRDTDGRVWFVRGAVPGDLVRVRALRRRKRSGEGVVAERLEDAPTRRTPPCPLQPRCGGCPWMVVDGAEQGRYKERLVRDALVRIAGAVDPPVAPIERREPALGYRSRIELTLGRGPCLGYREPGSLRLLDVPRCGVLRPAAVPLLDALREILGCVPGADGGEAPADAPRLSPIALPGDAGCALVLRGAGRRVPGGPRLARELADRIADLHGVVEVVARRGGRSPLERRRLYGEDHYVVEREGFRLRLPLDAFEQVHPEASAALAHAAVGEIERGVGAGDAVWWDLYAGAGVHGLAAARAGATSVTVVEIDRRAVAAGRRAAEEARLANVRHVAADVRRFLRRAAPDAPAAPAAPDAVVLNPPRGGLGVEAARALFARRPRRLVWVSCDPATFARDLRVGLEAGYGIERVVPYDLFPQTAHVETLAVVVRGSG